MQWLIFFFNDTATTEIYTLSLHDALPISQASSFRPANGEDGNCTVSRMDLGGHHEDLDESVFQTHAEGSDGGRPRPRRKEQQPPSQPIHRPQAPPPHSQPVEFQHAPPHTPPVSPPTVSAPPGVFFPPQESLAPQEPQRATSGASGRSGVDLQALKKRRAWQERLKERGAVVLSDRPDQWPLFAAQFDELRDEVGIEASDYLPALMH